MYTSALGLLINLNGCFNSIQLRDVLKGKGTLAVSVPLRTQNETGKIYYDLSILSLTFFWASYSSNRRSDTVCPSIRRLFRNAGSGKRSYRT